MTNKQKHLELIQGVINRMAGNLFFLKGWAITLMAGLFALTAKDTNPKYALVAFFPVIVFWILDGFFLSKERLFRALYNHVANLKEKDIDFSMNTEKYKVLSKNTWLSSIFSPTLLLFYLSLILSMALIRYFIIDDSGKLPLYELRGQRRTQIYQKTPSRTSQQDCKSFRVWQEKIN